MGVGARVNLISKLRKIVSFNVFFSTLYKKVIVFSVPSWDVTNQTLPGLGII
jgi:hypothetical protein